MTDVFVLGAGFSRAVNGAMPTLRELSDGLLPVLEDRDADLARRLARMGRDVELWMSYLSQGQPWLRSEENQYHLSVAGVVRRLIRSRIDGAVRESGPAPEWFETLVAQWHRRRTNVVTLNYDTLIERAARRVTVAGADEQEQGLLPCHLYPPYFASAGARAFGAWAPMPVETFALLKLHGSTNWFYSGQAEFHGETILWTHTAAPGSEVERATEQKQLAGVADKEILIIPPVTEKTTYFRNETVGQLWGDAAEAIRGTGRIVVIGYSLPPSDFGMRAFLSTVVGDSAVEVFVVDPDAEIADRYRQLLPWCSINEAFLGGGDPAARFARAYCRGEV